MHGEGMRPEYRPTINLGQVLQIFTMASAIVGYGIYVHIGLREGEQARSKYIPIIEQLEASDQLQNERIEIILRTITTIQTQNIDQAKVLGEISRDIAVIKERSGMGQFAPWPDGRVPQTKRR